MLGFSTDDGSATRREYLTYVGGVVGGGLLAGCSNRSGGGTEPAGTDTAAPTETPTPAATDPAAGTGTPAPTDTEPASPTSTAAGSGTPTVRVRSHPDLGETLVDGEGITLYMYDPDPQGSGSSTCYDGCADAWPPLTVEGDPTAGVDVAAELTTFERTTGAVQVAANGWPLYYWVDDEEPGDATGQGVNEVWWVLTPEGVPVRSDGSN
ncbi:hypothetical protein [Halosimplex halobium]|uniref:COG4315 family predicted lipoprotein n=1 Tax=Halosimplex halobium TaxID=3396618 RepID=UPI003F55D5A1